MQTITDLTGKTITVTDLPKAIKEAETYVYFSEADNNKRLLEYWSHVLAELKKLEAEPIEIKIEAEQHESKLVNQVRAIFPRKEGDKSKGFVKDGKTSPLYGLHSCAKTDRYIRKIDSLKVGECTTNGAGTLIMRIY